MVTWCSLGFRVGSCIVMCDKSLWWEIKILSRVEDGLEGAEGADINLGVGDGCGSAELQLSTSSVEDGMVRPGLLDSGRGG